MFLDAYVDPNKDAINKKEAIKIFSSKGIDVVDFEISQLGKEGKVYYKDISISFVDSQQITIRISDKKITKCLIQSKDIPLKDRSDYNAALNEIADYLNNNRSLYQKKLKVLKVKNDLEPMNISDNKLEKILEDKVSEMENTLNEINQDLLKYSQS